MKHMLMRLMRLFIPSRSAPVEAPKTRMSEAQAAAALGTIVLVASGNRLFSPGDTVALHLLAMRRYDVTPLDFAARVSAIPRNKLLDAVRAYLDDQTLELTIGTDQGWSFGDLDGAFESITTLKGLPPGLRPKGERRRHQDVSRN